MNNENIPPTSVVIAMAMNKAEMESDVLLGGAGLARMQLCLGDRPYSGGFCLICVRAYSEVQSPSQAIIDGTNSNVVRMLLVESMLQQ
jgi:hypothetical protein